MQTLTRILIAPASNMKVAVLVYGIIALLLILILVVGLLFVFAPGPDETEDAEATPISRKKVPKRSKPARPLSPEGRVLLGVGIVAVLLGVWVVAGYTTSDQGLCNSCHSDSRHAKADKARDPHVRVDCVSCHEPGGLVGRYLTGVPLRLLHLVTASAGADKMTPYGKVTARACGSCHAAALSGTVTNKERGLKMSHAEPLAASAGCLDCHTMRDGIVSAHNGGMKPCLRCHDDAKASSACTTCHEGTAAAATRARTTSFRNEQIRDVSCGGCHNEKRDCDSCHGLRMPHTTEFKSGAHARAAAVDIWYNGGNTCRRCHTASRRPCTKCHSGLMGRAHGVGMATSHKGANASACNTCHLQYAPIATRDFCKDLCHSPAAKAASPR
jgi:hypothetical protein